MSLAGNVIIRTTNWIWEALPSRRVLAMLDAARASAENGIRLGQGVLDPC